jgi:hypothetical protein
MKRKYDITEHGFRGCEELVQVEEYGVAQWCPTPDGIGTPEAVVIWYKPRGLSIRLRDGRAVNEIGLRMKSRHAINTFIEILKRHRDEVFPSDAP